ncbi:MAG: cytochrome d ubiquinol oxidase subunit II [Myxococcales bacterium]|nr:cytochrome d ubiquinol oxidase subunit II [Myxococcales bacterium]
MSLDALQLFIGGVMLAALLIYTLTGGADFGGGVWDLFARGPRADAQRRAIAEAIGPIWEANHVWLIVVIVLMFVAFPVAFAAISTNLHIPLLLVLFGIVLRGSAFVFRAYDPQSSGLDRRWSLVFSVASAATPVMLGVVLGAVCSDKILFRPTTGELIPDFVGAWLTPFPFAVGGFTLALFAFLAAVYLTIEADDPELRDDFRRRALYSAVASGVFAFVALGLAAREAPRIFEALTQTSWSIPLQLATAACAVGTMVALARKADRLARLLAIGQVTLIVVGFGAAQYPFVLAPRLTIYNETAPMSVLWPVSIALAIGTVLIAPAFAYLYLVFKRRRVVERSEAVK